MKNRAYGRDGVGQHDSETWSVTCRKKDRDPVLKVLHTKCSILHYYNKYGMYLEKFLSLLVEVGVRGIGTIMIKVMQGGLTEIRGKVVALHADKCD